MVRRCRYRKFTQSLACGFRAESTWRFLAQEAHMLESLERVHEARLARVFTPRALRAPSTATGLDVLLEATRQRNAVLDGVFYDIGNLSSAEAVELSPWLAAEGAIVIVPPSGFGSLQVCNTVGDFIAASGARIRALSVAGVGSSALGAAALARNVADAIGAPVAAVVSGYGLADAATEAFGGFFFFGALNALRHSFEWLDRTNEAVLGLDTTLPGEALSDELLVRSNRDAQTVYDLVSSPHLQFDLLVGHSKGNLVISEALYALNEEDRRLMRTLGQHWHIVTLSAVIAMPPTCKNVFDVIGALDTFGAANSRPDIAPDEVVPQAWHHTNTELPFHLPVKSVLADLRARGKIGAI
jgi:hypothetical protein